MIDARRSPVVPALLAVTVGATLWMLASLLGGRREPWDSSSYWAVVYPLGLATSAWLGYRYPDRAWLWPVLLFEAQFLAMCLRNGELGNLWPLGMALFAFMSLPGILAARLAARWGRRTTGGTQR